jgi:hypothetical protein
MLSKAFEVSKRLSFRIREMTKGASWTPTIRSMKRCLETASQANNHQTGVTDNKTSIFRDYSPAALLSLTVMERRRHSSKMLTKRCRWMPLKIYWLLRLRIKVWRSLSFQGWTLMRMKSPKGQVMAC